MNAIDAKLHLGESRKELIEAIGEPIKREHKYIESFSICVPKYDNLEYNLLLDVVTASLWELWAFPYELATLCDYRREIVVVYDKKYRISNILEKGQYEEIKSRYDTLVQAANKLDSDNKLFCINYDKQSGWVYVDKSNIECSSQKKYTKANVINVLSYDKAVQYKNSYQIETLPVLLRETVLLDAANNRYRILASTLLDDHNQLVTASFDEAWSEIYPNTPMNKVKDVLTDYCHDKAIDQYKNKEEPTILDFLGD